VARSKLICVECRRAAEHKAGRWRAYLIESDDANEEDEVLFYCPRCAVREFGERPSGSQRPPP
jgi:hypothetical protein